MQYPTWTSRTGCDCGSLPEGFRKDPVRFMREQDLQRMRRYQEGLLERETAYKKYQSMLAKYTVDATDEADAFLTALGNGKYNG